MEQPDDTDSESAITGLWGTDTNGKMLSNQITTEGEKGALCRTVLHFSSLTFGGEGGLLKIYFAICKLQFCIDAETHDCILWSCVLWSLSKPLCQDASSQSNRKNLTERQLPQNMLRFEESVSRRPNALDLQTLALKKQTFPAFVLVPYGPSEIANATTFAQKSNFTSLNTGGSEHEWHNMGPCI